MRLSNIFFIIQKIFQISTFTLMAFLPLIVLSHNYLYKIDYIEKFEYEVIKNIFNLPYYVLCIIIPVGLFLTKEFKPNIAQEATTINMVHEGPKERLVKRLSEIDHRLPRMRGKYTVRLTPNDIDCLKGPISELGDHSPIRLGKPLRRHLNSTFYNGSLGRKDDPEMFDVELEIGSGLHDASIAPVV